MNITLFSGEDTLFSGMIPEVNGAAVQFKLAPTYTLYMALRYRLSRHYQPDMPHKDRQMRITALSIKLARLIELTVQVLFTIQSKSHFHNLVLMDLHVIFVFRITVAMLVDYLSGWQMPLNCFIF